MYKDITLSDLLADPDTKEEEKVLEKLISSEQLYKKLKDSPLSFQSLLDGFNLRVSRDPLVSEENLMIEEISLQLCMIINKKEVMDWDIACRTFEGIDEPKFSLKYLTTEIDQHTFLEYFNRKRFVGYLKNEVIRIQKGRLMGLDKLRVLFDEVFFDGLIEKLRNLPATGDKNYISIEPDRNINRIYFNGLDKDLGHIGLRSMELRVARFNSNRLFREICDQTFDNDKKFNRTSFSASECDDQSLRDKFNWMDSLPKSNENHSQ